MDKKEKQKLYYQENKQRIIEKAKEYYKNHKEERQRYNQKYWEINGHQYVEQRKTSVDHKAKYQEMKEYYKAHSKKHYEKYGKEYSKTIYEKYGKQYYMKNKEILNEKSEQYRKDYYKKNQSNIHQKYLNRYHNIFIHDNDNKNLTVYFN